MSHWTILSVLFTTRISVAVAFQSVAAILPFLVRDVGLTHGGRRDEQALGDLPIALTS